MHPSIALQQLRGSASKNHPSGQTSPRLRFNWFLMGSLFGVSMSFVMNATVGSVVMPDYETASAELAQEPTPQLPTLRFTVSEPEIVDGQTTILEVAEAPKLPEPTIAVPEPETTVEEAPPLETAEPTPAPKPLELPEVKIAKAKPEAPKAEAKPLLPIFNTAAIMRLIRSAATDEAVAPILKKPAPTLADLPEPAIPTYPRTIAMEVPKGGTLLNMLMDKGISREESYGMVEALKKVYKPTQMRAGQEMELVVDRDPLTQSFEIDALTIKLSKVEYVEALKAQEGFEVAKKEIALQPERTLAGGTITSSLFKTGYDQGVPDGVLAEMVKAFSYDVDFQRDIRTGAKMEVLYDNMLNDAGEKISYGDIHYAMLDIGKKDPIKIYRFEDKSGDVGFFAPNGHSIIKSLLKTPINGARISSGFGMRHHPVLGYSKMHKGTDFAAPTGTPIYAAGDGVITYAGRKGAYGNFVMVKHNGTYSTAYAHASSIAKGIRNGAKVKQGQVIAYVGTTGRSTGPHLHYEVRKNGTQVNPKSMKLPTGRVLAGADLENFKRHVAHLDNQIASMAKDQTQMARADVE